MKIRVALGKQIDRRGVWLLLGVVLLSIHCGSDDSPGAVPDGAPDTVFDTGDQPRADAGTSDSRLDDGNSTDAFPGIEADVHPDSDEPTLDARADQADVVSPDEDVSAQDSRAPDTAPPTDGIFDDDGGFYDASVDVVQGDPPVSDTAHDDVVMGDAAFGHIWVEPTSGLVVNESGLQIRFSLVLGSQPTADVTIALSSTRPDEGAVSPSQVTFTPGNWNTRSWVTVTGVDDNLCDGNQDFTIVTAPSVSLDPIFNAVDTSDVTATNVDNESGGFIVHGQNLSSSETGGAATFAIMLSCQPVADVVLPIVSTDTTEVVVSPSFVTFTSRDWSSLHTITATGVDDAADDGDQVVLVTLGPATSADPTFGGQAAPNVSVTNVDDD
jgi:hypothetical protein